MGDLTNLIFYATRKVGDNLNRKLQEKQEQYEQEQKERFEAARLEMIEHMARIELDRREEE